MHRYCDLHWDGVVRMTLRIRALHVRSGGLPVELTDLLRDMMMTKTLFILPVTLALLAGCASSSDTQSPQASANCSNLSGAALVECQKEVQPTSSTGSTFKMVKPKPVNGKTG